MLKPGKTRRAIAMAAATLAVAGGATLGLGGAAHAQATAASHPAHKHGVRNPAATRAPATGCVINVGLPGDYYYKGVRAGQIEQQFDICPGDSDYHHVMAHWQWDGAFQANPANAGVYVYLAVGSPFWSGPPGSGSGGTWWNSLSGGPSFVNGPKDAYTVDPYSYNVASPDEWRAGAMLGQGPTASGCTQWGSLHYYGDGSEQDVPVGGCGSRYSTAPI